MALLFCLCVEVGISKCIKELLLLSCVYSFGISVNRIL